MSRERETLIREITDAIRASQNATEAFDEVAAPRLGINRTDMRCLDIIQRVGQVSAGQLAEESRLTTGAVTAVIDRLEHAGLARRVADPRDRRRVMVELTELATARTDAIWGPMQARVEKEWKRYSIKELEFLLSFWVRGRRLQLEALKDLESLPPFDG
jgi:DNA-binding MarR family transcriptional regulator